MRDLRRLFAVALMFSSITVASGCRSTPVAGGADVPRTVLESEATLRFVDTNGIRMRIAEQGQGPLVLLLHGWPESWYSWRHQLRALAEAGYRAVAPDMRGFGGTDAPEDVEAYDVLDLCADTVGLLDALGAETAVLVGHDWGAAVAWSCVQLEPSRFTAIAALSVPRGRRQPEPFLERMRKKYGENFFYMLYFQQPGVAEAELEADPRALLTRLFTSPDTPREPPEITDPKAAAGGFIGRLGAPTELPPWLSEKDLDYYVSELTRTGFSGGLNYYRNIGRNRELTPQLADAQVAVPALFIAGDKDLVIGGLDRAALEELMRPVVPELRGLHLLSGAGHWIQQERAEEVNALLIDFLRSLPFDDG